MASVIAEADYSEDDQKVPGELFRLTYTYDDDPEPVNIIFTGGKVISALKALVHAGSEDTVLQVAQSYLNLSDLGAEHD